MRKIKILVSILLIALFTVSLIGCKKDKPEDETDKPKELVYSDGTELNMAVVHNNTKTSISFKDATITGTGLKLADGVTYQTYDLKPVWAELEKILKVKFKDVYSGATSADNEFKYWKNLKYDGVDVVVGNADSISEEGKLGKMVDLSTWLDYMPNFKKFLEDNPIVYLSLISDTEKGSIYYAPYFDGYDDIEKYFLMRTDWIEDLLDGSGAFTASTSDTFGDICGTAAYQPYMPTSGKLQIESLNAAGTGKETITKNYDTTYGNIISYMNSHVTASTTGVELVNMLRNYIDAAYGNKYGTKRSDLFAGYNACWDVDELVALLRCVVTNTYTLTGQNETKVTGVFPRENTLNRTSDLFSLVSLFGVRGYESRNSYLYFNANGELCDARGDKEYAEAINKLNTLYKEGLIMKDFDTTKDTIYKVMYQQNLGFMIYDYCQTQCLYNNDATTLAKDPDFNLTPIINPVAKWFDGSDEKGVWMRFTESWRSVKTSGWGIPTTCTGEKLQAALKMFDYMYSTEGAQLMSYGPSAWRSGNTITYKGQQIPELSEAALKELWDLAGGNYTNYARMYLGSTLPIGFVKDQGMEYQCTTEGGKVGAAKVSAAIAAGVIKHVTPDISDNLFYTMVPTVLPTTAAQDSILSGYAALGEDGLYSKTKKKYNIYTEVLKKGFGSDAALNNTLITTMPKTADELVNKFKFDLGGNSYILIQQSAWDKINNFYKNKLAK
jgi:hypothetical protein